jgi:hypothetical protein
MRSVLPDYYKADSSQFVNSYVDKNPFHHHIFALCLCSKHIGPDRLPASVRLRDDLAGCGVEGVGG